MKAKDRPSLKVNGRPVSDGLKAGDAIDSGHEIAPPRSLFRENLPSRPGEAIVAPAALTRFLDPLAFQPATFLEAVQQRIQSGGTEPKRPVRSRFDQLADLVTVALSRFDERQDQQLGAALLSIRARGRAHSEIA